MLSLENASILMLKWTNIAGRSDWDDGRWEWADTPRQDSHSDSGRYQPSPSPMLVGASPDARLVSPWLGGHTPHSTGNFDKMPSPPPSFSTL